MKPQKGARLLPGPIMMMGVLGMKSWKGACGTVTKESDLRAKRTTLYKHPAYN